MWFNETWYVFIKLKINIFHLFYYKFIPKDNYALYN